MLLRDLLNNPDTPASILNLVILKEYGAQCYNWELETLWLELIDDFKLKEINEFTRSKIAALISLNVSDQFYNKWECFENIGNALNHMLIQFHELTPLEPEHMVWTVLESKLLDNSKMSFGHDVEAYIKTVLKSSGISTVPKFIKDDVKYNTYNKYDKGIELMYQKRIEAHTLMQLDKIIRQAKEYFGHDLRNDIAVELPDVKGYLKL